ncbi:DNA-binding protein [Lachnospiraceae bacterium 48-21]
MNKKSMSVTEMRRLLGIGKTDSYWLVKKGYFETVIIAGKIRVIVDSFEKWYDNQLHYKKVDGTPPGKNWTGITFSIREVAELLKKNVFRTARVGQATRIYKDSFEEWYQSQTYYIKADVHKEVIDL